MSVGATVTGTRSQPLQSHPRESVPGLLRLGPLTYGASRTILWLWCATRRTDECLGNHLLAQGRIRHYAVLPITAPHLSDPSRQTRPAIRDHEQPHGRVCLDGHGRPAVLRAGHAKGTRNRRPHTPIWRGDDGVAVSLLVSRRRTGKRECAVGSRWSVLVARTCLRLLGTPMWLTGRGTYAP